jgi:hypothetical protein
MHLACTLWPVLIRNHVALRVLHKVLHDHIDIHGCRVPVEERRERAGAAGASSTNGVKKDSTMLQEVLGARV